MSLESSWDSEKMPADRPHLSESLSALGRSFAEAATAHPLTDRVHPNICPACGAVPSWSTSHYCSRHVNEIKDRFFGRSDHQSGIAVSAVLRHVG